MAIIDTCGYVCRRTATGKNNSCISPRRNWYLVAEHRTVELRVKMPERLIGKRIRFKLEVIKDKEK